ncbi:hypothetical protein SGRIM128S_08295 [Streptomyces griseomycini]
MDAAGHEGSVGVVQDPPQVVVREGGGRVGRCRGEADAARVAVRDTVDDGGHRFRQDLAVADGAAAADKFAQARHVARGSAEAAAGGLGAVRVDEVVRVLLRADPGPDHLGHQRRGADAGDPSQDLGERLDVAVLVAEPGAGLTRGPRGGEVLADGGRPRVAMGTQPWGEDGEIALRLQGLVVRAARVAHPRAHVQEVVDLGVPEGGAGEFGDVLGHLGAAVEVPFVGEGRGQEAEIGLGGGGVEVRDVGLVAVQVLLVDESAPVQDEQGVRLGLGEQRPGSVSVRPYGPVTLRPSRAPGGAAGRSPGRPGPRQTRRLGMVSRPAVVCRRAQAGSVNPRAQTRSASECVPVTCRSARSGSADHGNR